MFRFQNKKGIIDYLLVTVVLLVLLIVLVVIIFSMKFEIIKFKQTIDIHIESEIKGSRITAFLGGKSSVADAAHSEMLGYFLADNYDKVYEDAIKNTLKQIKDTYSLCIRTGDGVIRLGEPCVESEHDIFEIPVPGAQKERFKTKVELGEWEK